MGRARAETVRVKKVRLMRWTIVAVVRGVVSDLRWLGQGSNMSVCVDTFDDGRSERGLNTNYRCPSWDGEEYIISDRASSARKLRGAVPMAILGAKSPSRPHNQLHCLKAQTGMVSGTPRAEATILVRKLGRNELNEVA